MKFLKWLLIILVAIVAIVLIYGATQPSQMKIEESIEINASANRVFTVIKDFETWSEWSAWSKMDPDMKETYEGEKGTVGYKNTWVSENPMVGIGSQEVFEIRENEFMKTKMLFNGDAAENYASFTLKENDGKTTVVWDMLGAETPFYARIMNTIFEPMIRESYRSSLKDLKEMIESKPAQIPNPMNLEIVEVEGIKIISVRDTTTSEGISNMLRDLYTELAIYMGSNDQVQMNGMPIGIYHSYSEDFVDMEAAFPITGDAVSKGRIVVGSTPAGKSLRGIHLGEYDASINMHYAIEKYDKANDEIELQGMCWEIYANDPDKVDSAEIRTEIYYPLR